MSSYFSICYKNMLLFHWLSLVCSSLSFLFHAHVLRITLVSVVKSVFKVVITGMYRVHPPDQSSLTFEFQLTQLNNINNDSGSPIIWSLFHYYYSILLLSFILPLTRSLSDDPEIAYSGSSSEIM